MKTTLLDIRTGSAESVVDLSGACARFLAESDAEEGLLNVWVPHATAGVAVLETGAGSDTDLLAALRTLLPADDRWQHRHGSPGHGRDHVLPGSSLRTPPSRCSAVRWRWARGSRCAWWTPTATTRPARCASATWQAERRAS